MASFSFGAGNARKLMRIPLYIAGRLATALIPRTRDEWVFGCGAGIGDGALALWDVVAGDGHRALWLAGSDQEAQDAAARGIPTIPKHSLRGFWRTARARVVVVTHGFGDVNRYAIAGAFIVQLWHGIPLKRIGLDSPETVRSGILPSSTLMPRLLGMLYRSTVRAIGLLPAASDLVRGRLESAFALPDERVPVVGEPRVDVLSQGTPFSRRAAAREGIAAAVGPVDPGARLVLYAPTWRDGAPDPAVPTASEWRLLTDTLERHDAVLLVRSHPLGAGEYAPPFPTGRVRAIGSALVSDITPLLPGFDVLLTDYSSLAFDAALVPLPTLFLAPDLEEYARRRGFYGSYEDVAGDDWARDWAGATGDLDAVLAGGVAHDSRIARARALSARVHAFHDGGNTRRLYGVIPAALRVPTPHRGATERESR